MSSTVHTVSAPLLAVAAMAHRLAARWRHGVDAWRRRRDAYRAHETLRRLDASTLRDLGLPHLVDEAPRGITIDGYGRGPW